VGPAKLKETTMDNWDGFRDMIAALKKIDSFWAVVEEWKIK
jgi:hypothetical protein